MAKEDNVKKLKEFFSGDVIPQYKVGILEGHPLIFRTKDDEPWGLQADEIENILHLYHPELSAVVYENRIVIFHEAE